MAGPDSKIRFANAATLLNYGFGICRIYKDEEPPEAGEIKVTGGKKKYFVHIPGTLFLSGYRRRGLFAD